MLHRSEQCGHSAASFRPPTNVRQRPLAPNLALVGEFHESRLTKPTGQENRQRQAWVGRCLTRFEWSSKHLKLTCSDWLYEFATSAYHATLEDWFGWLLDAGFVVRAIREPAPTVSAMLAHPDLEDACRIPYYLMFDLERTK